MSKLLEEMFKYENWISLIDKAEQKNINKTILRKMCEEKTRVEIYTRIKEGRYEISPPHIVLIPKDNGDFRECKANEDEDRIILTLINDCLMKLFPEMIHDKCKSYQKSIGCAEVVQNVVGEINKVQGNFIGYKVDLSKYFDSVSINWIDWAFYAVERRLGYKPNTEPVLNMLRKYYHNDWLFDVDGNLVQKYTSLKQGSAVAAWLADVILYDVDDYLSKYCDVYVRYSDDMLLIGRNATKAKEWLEEKLTKYGLKLNPKKVEPLYKNEWFTFLGFKVKGNMITLSKNRVKNFQKEVEKRTIKVRKISQDKARASVMKYLYEGDYNWATSCFSIINVEKDIDELNKFIMDCLRACKTGKKKIGGLGSVNNLSDKTILRGTGKNVSSNRAKTDKRIESYISVGCLVKDYQTAKPVFEAVVRGIR